MHFWIEHIKSLTVSCPLCSIVNGIGNINFYSSFSHAFGSLAETKHLWILFFFFMSGILWGVILQHPKFEFEFYLISLVTLAQAEWMMISVPMRRDWRCLESKMSCPESVSSRKMYIARAKMRCDISREMPHEPKHN